MESICGGGYKESFWGNFLMHYRKFLYLESRGTDPVVDLDSRDGLRFFWWRNSGLDSAELKNLSQFSIKIEITTLQNFMSMMVWKKDFKALKKVFKASKNIFKAFKKVFKESSLGFKESFLPPRSLLLVEASLVPKRRPNWMLSSNSFHFFVRLYSDDGWVPLIKEFRSMR